MRQAVMAAEMDDKGEHPMTIKIIFALVIGIYCLAIAYSVFNAWRSRKRKSRNLKTFMNRQDDIPWWNDKVIR